MLRGNIYTGRKSFAYFPNQILMTILNIYGRRTNRTSGLADASEAVKWRKMALSGTDPPLKECVVYGVRQKRA
jgi:hypothetical protein